VVGVGEVALVGVGAAGCARARGPRTPRSPRSVAEAEAEAEAGARTEAGWGLGRRAGQAECREGRLAEWRVEVEQREERWARRWVGRRARWVVAMVCVVLACVVVERVVVVCVMGVGAGGLGTARGSSRCSG